MILYEYEGKKLLKEAGIKVPKSELVESKDQNITFSGPAVLKAQVLSGKRADAGGIIKIDNGQLTIDNLKKLLGKTINKEKVEKVLVEEMVEFEAEYYLSLSYDTETRGPVLTVSQSGGTGIEERGAKSYKVDPITMKWEVGDEKWGFEVGNEILEKLIKLFFNQDLLLLEINPLVITGKGERVCLDAKINLDDTAFGRHPEWKDYPPRSVAGYTPTKNEIEAKKIDEGDYRGTAGSTYFDFDGDIAILASGGGASITAMDALIAVGGKAANFTEYSGNPPREKVEKLTKIVLNKPALHGLWIVGALANFTDIFETLSGIVDALEKIDPKPKYPIVIRRAGPRDKEAFEMLKKVRDLDLHLYGEDTSIPQSAKIVADLARKYSENSENQISQKV